MAAKNFTVKTRYNSLPMLKLEKASATVIKPGDMVTLDSNGLAIIAGAAATKLANAPAGGDSGKDYVMVVGDPDCEYYSTAEVNYAETQRGIIYDMAEAAGVQTLNQGATSTTVLKVAPTYDAGTV